MCVSRLQSCFTESTRKSSRGHMGFILRRGYLESESHLSFSFIVKKKLYYIYFLIKDIFLWLCAFLLSEMYNKLFTGFRVFEVLVKSCVLGVPLILAWAWRNTFNQFSSLLSKIQKQISILMFPSYVFIFHFRLPNSI